MKLRQRIPKVYNPPRQKNNQKKTKMPKKFIKLNKKNNPIKKTKKIKKNVKVTKMSLKQRENRKKDKKIVQKVAKKVGRLQINSYRKKLRPQRTIRRFQPLLQDLTFMKKKNKKSAKKTKILLVSPPQSKKPLIKKINLFNSLNKVTDRAKSISKQKKRKAQSMKKAQNKKDRIQGQIKKGQAREQRDRKKNRMQEKTLSENNEEPAEDLNYINVNMVKLQDDENIKMKSIAQLLILEQRFKKRLYLKNILRINNTIIFDIIDYKSTNRTVKFSTDRISCACFTYRSTRQPCEHILFVIQKVLKNQDLQYHIKYKTEISEDIFAKIDGQVLKRFHKRFSKKQGEQSEYESDLQVCEICFEERDENEQRQECIKCGKNFHRQCCLTFRKIKQNCPLCIQSDKENQDIKLQPVCQASILEI